MVERSTTLEDVYTYDGSLIGVGNTKILSSFTGPSDVELVFDDADDDRLAETGETGTIDGEAITNAAHGTVTVGLSIGGLLQINLGSSVQVNVMETGGGTVVQYPNGDQASLADGLLSTVLSTPGISTVLGLLGIKDLAAYIETNALMVFSLSDSMAIPVCFAAETEISTRRGNVLVEDLSLSDDIITRDHGYQPIRWIGRRTVLAIGAYAPILFEEGTIGNSHPIRLSPEHRVLRTGAIVQLLIDSKECFVAAKYLVNGHSIRHDPGGLVTYYHILLDQHEIVIANGALCESFHPGPVAMCAIDDTAREELMDLFPDIVAAAGNGDLPLARPILRRHEAKLISRTETPDRAKPIAPTSNLTPLERALTRP